MKTSHSSRIILRQQNYKTCLWEVNCKIRLIQSEAHLHATNQVVPHANSTQPQALSDLFFPYHFLCITTGAVYFLVWEM